MSSQLPLKAVIAQYGRHFAFVPKMETMLTRDHRWCREMGIVRHIKNGSTEPYRLLTKSSPLARTFDSLRHASQTDAQLTAFEMVSLGSVGLDPRLVGNHSLRRTKAICPPRRFTLPCHTVQAVAPRAKQSALGNRSYFHCDLGLRYSRKSRSITS